MVLMCVWQIIYFTNYDVDYSEAFEELLCTVNFSKTFQLSISVKK